MNERINEIKYLIRGMIQSKVSSKMIIRAAV